MMKIDFSKHIAIFLNDNNNVIFKVPGSGFDAMRFDIIGRSLVVTGDLDDAIYTFSGNPPITFDWLAGLCPSYLRGKCVASSLGRFPHAWSSELALDKLCGILNMAENIKDVKKFFDESPQEYITYNDYHMSKDDIIRWHEEDTHVFELFLGHVEDYLEIGNCVPQFVHNHLQAIQQVVSSKNIV